MIVEIIVVVLIALLVTYSIDRWRTSQSTYQGSSSVYDISKPNQVVLPNANLPWSNRACALRFGIYVKQAPRTLAKVDCVVDNTKAFAPSCSDYSYKRCDCNGIQCGSATQTGGSNCALSEDAHSYLSKLLSCGDALQLWASGYTSQTDRPYVPAILRLRTVKTVSQHAIESVTLPALPLQAWTIVTIVKEGRRIDVYYGTKVVASKILDYIPATSGGQPWIAGNSKWKGQIGLFTGIQQAWTSRDVEKDVSSLVDTRGIPHVTTEVNITDTLKSISVPSCSLGNCNTLPTVNPQNPFTAYDTRFN
jgi:hypothetical protein